MKEHSREGQIRRVLIVTLFLNFLVAGLKIFAGHFYHLLGLVSSGHESLLDGGANILGLVSITLAARPPDEDHHFGHQKYETFAGLFISFFILLAAYNLGINIKNRIFLNSPLELELSGLYWPMATVIISILVSLWVSRYEHRQGKELGSPLLIADAGHTFGDFLIGIGVLVSMIAVANGLLWADWVCALIVCFYMVFLGLKLAKMNLEDLLDAGPEVDPALLAKVEDLEFVDDIHHFRARGNPHWLQVDFHLHLDPNLTLIQAHQVGEKAKQIVAEGLSQISQQVDVLVHIEPSHRENL